MADNLKSSRRASRGLRLADLVGSLIERAEDQGDRDALLIAETYLRDAALALGATTADVEQVLSEVDAILSPWQAAQMAEGRYTVLYYDRDRWIIGRCDDQRTYTIAPPTHDAWIDFLKNH